MVQKNLNEKIIIRKSPRVQHFCYGSQCRVTQWKTAAIISNKLVQFYSLSSTGILKITLHFLPENSLPLCNIHNPLHGGPTYLSKSIFLSSYHPHNTELFIDVYFTTLCFSSALNFFPLLWISFPNVSTWKTLTNLNTPSESPLALHSLPQPL